MRRWAREQWRRARMAVLRLQIANGRRKLEVAQQRCDKERVCKAAVKASTEVAEQRRYMLEGLAELAGVRESFDMRDRELYMSAQKAIAAWTTRHDEAEINCKAYLCAIAVTAQVVIDDAASAAEVTSQLSGAVAAFRQRALAAESVNRFIYSMTTGMPVAIDARIDPDDIIEAVARRTIRAKS